MLKYLLGIITALIFVAAFVVYFSLPQNMDGTALVPTGSAGDNAASSGGAVTRPAPSVPLVPSTTDDNAPPPPPASGTNN